MKKIKKIKNLKMERYLIGIAVLISAILILSNISLAGGQANTQVASNEISIATSDTQNEEIQAPKGTSITKLKALKKGFTVTWKKQASSITGYQIQYWKTGDKSKLIRVKVKNPETTSKKIKKLKAGQKYSVKVRTYKIVDGKYYYSSWCTTKRVRTLTRRSNISNI